MPEATSRKPSALLVIPVRNPDPVALSDTLAAARALNTEMCIVDDGSREPVTIADTRVIRHSHPKGWGQAALTGAQTAQQSGATHIIMIGMARGQNLTGLAGLLKTVDQHPDALVVGQRRSGTGQRRSWWHRLEQRFAATLFRIQTAKQVGDVGSDICAYPVATLMWLKLWSRGTAFSREVLVRTAWAGLEIRSTDIQDVERGTTPPSSHTGRAFNLLTLVAMNIHLTMRSIVPWPHRRWTDNPRPQRLTILHPLRSLKRLILENASPRGIALSAALGVLLGTLPLLFVHTVSIIMAANFLRLNKPAAITASQLCMPPLVPALCIEIGYWLRHGHWLTEISLRTLGYEAWDRVLEWALGSILLAPILAGLVGLATYTVACIVRHNLQTFDTPTN